MKRDVSRLFAEALADRSAGRLRLGAIAGATALVLVVTAGVAVWPALGSHGQSGRLAARISPTRAPAGPSSSAPAGSPTPAPSPPGAAVGAGGPAAAPSPTAAPSSSPAPNAAPPPPATVPTAVPAPAVVAAAVAAAAQFSFEDGGTDGWGGTGHVTSLANSGTEAHDGARSLQVGLHSTGSGDLPYVGVSVSGASAPASGQTLTLWVFVSSGSVQGKLFVQDTSFGWHMSGLTTLARGGWTELSLTVPSGISVNRLGAQFLCTPFNTTTTVFVDEVNWS
jgi:hypothetical protein